MFNVLKLVESTDWIINLMYMFLMMKETGSIWGELANSTQKGPAQAGI